MRRSTIASAVTLVLSCLIFGSALAYETNANCNNCHGDFKEDSYTSLKDGTAWNDNLMDGHESFIDGNANACDSCHSGEEKIPVNMSFSDAAAKPQGCVGCHGREADETGVCTFGAPDSSGKHCGSAAGLRSVHMSSPSFTGTSCYLCHSNDNGAVLVGEDSIPFNYGLTGIGQTSPCTAENVYGPTGLDNDGDGDRDAADTDCSPAAEAFSKVVALPDVNSNGNTDLAVIRSGSIIVEIRDGQAGALLNTMYFLGNDFTPVTGAALSDADNNGVSEFAVLATRNSDGRMVVEIRNVSGAAAPRQIWFAAGHSPVTMAVIEDDADGNTVPEIAVLSSRDSDGRGLVEIKNAFGATNPNAVWVGPGLAAGDPGDYALSDLEIVPDADSNGVPEVAVLMTRVSDNRIVVDIQNAAGSTDPHAVWFMAGNTAIDLVVVPDKDANNIPEVAVLSSRDSDGRNVVEIKNAAGPTLTSAVWFAAGNSAKQVSAVLDADNNGIPEVAVGSIRDNDSRTLIEIKNVSGATNTNAIWYSAGFTAAGMTILNDVDNNSVEEVGVIMFRDSDNRILVQGRNASGNVTQIDYWFSP